MCQGVPALKEHMALCHGGGSGTGGNVPTPPTGSQGMYQAQGMSQEEGHHLCHVCDKVIVNLCN